MCSEWQQSWQSSFKVELSSIELKSKRRWPEEEEEEELTMEFDNVEVLED